jgi:ketosteroid isomerase-like protein
VRLRLLILGATLVGGAGPPALAQAASHGTGVEATLDAWTTMWNTYDLSEVDRLFVPDSTVTYFSSEYDGLIRGIDSLRAHHRRFGFTPGGTSRGTRLWLTEIETRVKGEITTVLATWHFQRADGTGQHGPLTMILLRFGDRWRITHAHFANAPPPTSTLLE